MMAYSREHTHHLPTNRLLSILFTGLLLLAGNHISAQKRYILELQYDSGQKTMTRLFQDSLSAELFIQSEIEALMSKAHLEAAVDNKKYPNDSTTVASIHIGPEYEWAELAWSVTDPIFRKPANWDKKWQSKPISIKELSKQKKNLLKQATERGYPFASVFFKDIKIEQNQFHAKINAEKGPFITMDDITVEGEKIVNDNRIWHYVLDMKKGSPIVADKIIHIDDRINELPFVSTTAPAQVIFKAEEASIKLFLKKKKSNHFDIILGLQPASSSDPTQTKTILTGQITADLYNMIASGERIFFDYRRFNKDDQNVQLGLTWPYLPATRIGADANFQLQKRDTSHLDLLYNLGMKIPLRRRSSLKLIFQENISSILSINKASIQSSGKLPSVLDYKLSSFGIEGGITTLDYNISPTSGWDIRLKTLAGKRNIKKNQKIISLSRPGADFSTLYDSIQSGTIQLRFDLFIDKYTTITRHQILRTGLQSGSILSGGHTLRNELYRIGGYRLLRGFDEQSLEVSKYLVGTIEYRYLLSQLSYAFAFSDIAITNTRYGDTDFNDQPLSFGLGVTLQTKAGLFGIAAAVGQRKGLPFDFRSPKIHFGYVSVF